MARRRFVRRGRRKRPLWAWVGGSTSLTWSSSELENGTHKNTILVDEPVLSSHGLDSTTRVERIVMWLELFMLNGPYAAAPNWKAVLWNGVEDVTDTPTGTPDLTTTSNGDFWADKRIMMFDNQVLIGDDPAVAGANRLVGESYRQFKYDIKVRRKVPPKGHVSFVQTIATGPFEEGSGSAILRYRCLVVADYR